MFLPCILMFVMSVLLILWGTVGLRYVAQLLRDRRNLTESTRHRTGRTMGTVLGGSATLYGERLRCPLVRFEVDGKECLATGPVINAIRRGREKAIKGGVLLLPRTEFGYVRFHSTEFVRVVEAIRMTQTGGNEEQVRDRWNLSYKDSVLSSLYPVGSQVAVSYDPEYPQSNNAILLPDGSDGEGITALYIREMAKRAIVEMASGLILCGMAVWFLMGYVIVLA